VKEQFQKIYSQNTSEIWLIINKKQSFLDQLQLISGEDISGFKKLIDNLNSTTYKCTMMNYKLFSQLEGVYSFVAINTYLFLSYNNIGSVDKLNEILTIESKIAVGNKFALKSFIDYLYVYDGLGKRYILSRNLDNTVAMSNISINTFASVIAKQVICNMLINSENNIGLYDIENNKLVWYNKYDIGVVCEQNIKYVFGKLRIYPSELICLDKQNGDIVWQTDISEIGSYTKKGKDYTGEIKKILGVYENTLIVVLAGGKLLGLNVDMGAVEWILDEGVLPDGRKFTTIPQAEFLQFNQDNTRLLAFHYLHLVEIDLTTHTFIRFKNIEQSVFEQIGEKIKIIASTLKDNYFFFTAERQGYGFGSGLVGAFHIETETVDWWQDMNFANGTFFPAGEAPKVDDNRLYVLDSEGTLHIFEREGE
jgi:hypothetical protein